MILFLRVAFIAVIVAMFAVTIWASNQVALWNIQSSVGGHPWFIATLFDTYFAFLTFYIWVVYKETSILARIYWLLAILTLGNFAIAFYMLLQLFRLPLNANMDDLVLRKKA